MRFAALLLLAPACQQSPKADVAPAGAATASAALARSAAPSARAPSKAWFEGAWQGVFEAQLFRIVVPAGGAKEWKQDDGKKATGEGKLAFDVAPDGSVTGSASGALGDLTLSGQIDGQRAALVLSSATSDGFHGVILASQAPQGMTGTLNASSGDSLLARQATVTISRAGQ